MLKQGLLTTHTYNDDLLPKKHIFYGKRNLPYHIYFHTYLIPLIAVLYNVFTGLFKYIHMLYQCFKCIYVVFLCITANYLLLIYLVVLW